jgi:hypothetical protein
MKKVEFLVNVVFGVLIAISSLYLVFTIDQQLTGELKLFAGFLHVVLSAVGLTLVFVSFIKYFAEETFIK